MTRPLSVDVLVEVLKGLGAAVVALLAVGAIEPIMAVVLVTVVNFAVSWWILPRPAKTEQYTPEELASYAGGRTRLFREHGLRIGTYLAALVTVAVLANGFGVPSAIGYFSLLYALAVGGETLIIVVQANRLLKKPVEWFENLIPRKP